MIIFLKIAMYLIGAIIVAALILVLVVVVVAFAKAIADQLEKDGLKEQNETPGACAACQCDDCTRLDTCQQFPVSDGLYPPPCKACQGKTGPLVPKNRKPCKGYIAPRAAQEGATHDQ